MTWTFTMKKTIYPMMLLAYASIALAQVLITEVYYDAVDETGSEAVEIFNPTDSDQDISGLIISTESSANDAILPEGTVIKAASHFLIADSGWSTDKDKPTWPDADYEETITLYNTDSGVALILNNQTIDAVGWGEPTGINEGFFEGTPAEETSQGETLTRKKVGEDHQDTDNNFDDFEVTAPNLQGSSATKPQNSTDLAITITITGTGPDIVEINLKDDELDEPGIQYFPNPGGIKEVLMDVEVSDDNGHVDISEVRGIVNDQAFTLAKTQELTSNNALYSGSFLLDYFDESGNYTVTITAMDLSNITTQSSAQFSYMEIAAIELDTSALSFTSSAGSSFEILGDIDMATVESPTLKNIGNSVIDIGISGTDYLSNDEVISSSSMTFTFLDNVFSGSLAGTIGHEPEIIDVNVPYGMEGFRELGLRLDAPLDSLPGTYIGSIYLFGISS